MAYREGSPYVKLVTNTVHTSTASLCCTFDQLLDVLFRYLRFSQRFCWRCKSSGVLFCCWGSGSLKVTASHPSRLHSSYFRSFKIVIEYYAFQLLLGLISKCVSKIVLNLGNKIPILGVRNILFLLLRLQNFVKRLLVLWGLSVRPHGTSGSHVTYFREIWYLSAFRKYVVKSQVSLKSDKNNRYFTWSRPIYVFYHI
jgi:hypothetical protein